MADLGPAKPAVKEGIIRPIVRWGVRTLVGLGIIGGAAEYYGRTSPEQDEANRAAQQNERIIREAKEKGIRPEVVAARRREAVLNGSNAQEAAIQALIDADNHAHPGRTPAEKDAAALVIRNRERDRLEALKLGTPTATPTGTPTGTPAATMHGTPTAGETVIGGNSVCRVTAKPLSGQRQVTFQCDTATLAANTQLVITSTTGTVTTIDNPTITNAGHTLRAMVNPSVLASAERMVVRTQGTTRPVTVTFNDNDRGVIRSIPTTP